jgi:hypothetical protein
MKEPVMTNVAIRCATAAPLAVALLAGGCINVTAPEKPIVITLNVNITQEVVYRLDSEAKTLIQRNPGIF